MAPTTNHFITVSKTGVMHARRKGQGSVAIAKGAIGLEVRPDPTSVPRPVFVRFRSGGSNRAVIVTEIAFGDDVLPVADFQARFAVTDDELGQWMRTVVDAVLDRHDSRIVGR